MRVLSVLLNGWAAVLAAPLLAYAFLGWFSRYASDDFCTAAVLVERGFLGAQTYWYTAWSGRFSFFALVTAFEVVGAGVAQVLPALAIVGWVATTAWTVAPLARAAGWPAPRLVALILAELIVFATLAAAPNLGQVLWWQTGLLTYLLPLILLTAFGGMLARGCASRLNLAGAGLLLLLAGGLSETTLVLQAVVVGGGVVLAWRMRQGRAVRLLAAGLAGTLLAGAIQALAPGNAVRTVADAYPGATLAGLPLGLKASVALIEPFMRRFEAEFRGVCVATLILPGALGFWVYRTRSVQPPWRAAVRGQALLGIAVLVGGAVLIGIAWFPSYWVLGFDPPARVQVVAQWVLVVTVAAEGYVVGTLLAVFGRSLGHSRAVGPAVGVILLPIMLVPLVTAANVLATTAEAAEYAARYDVGAGLLRAGRGQTVTVPAEPPRWGWDYFGPEPGDFPNTCAARYYGVAAVRAS